MKILVIQLAGDAELLLSTLLLRCLKQQVTDAELHVLVKYEQANLMANNPHIDKLHQLQFNAKTIVEELKSVGFDKVINLHPSSEAEAIKDALQVVEKKESQKGFKRFFAQLFQRKGNMHVAEEYLKRSNISSLVNDGGGLQFIISKEEEVPYADIPAAHQAGFIVLAVRAFDKQQWPLYFLQQLLAAIQHPLILIGSNEDRALAEKVKAVDDVKIYNACGKFSVQETADLIQKSKLVITSHSYYVQAAAALKKDLVWLQTSAVAAPYYGQLFVEKHAKLPFDNVKVQATFFDMDKASTAFDATANKLVADVVARINQRLKKTT